MAAALGQALEGAEPWRKSPNDPIFLQWQMRFVIVQSI